MPESPKWYGGMEGYLVQGKDNAGWTMDEYVLPRLQSGLITGTEISAVEARTGRLTLPAPHSAERGGLGLDAG
jgi:hypothetical protein